MIEYMEAKYVNKFYKTSGILRQISNQIDYRKKLSKFYRYQTIGTLYKPHNAKGEGNDYFAKYSKVEVSVF